MTGCSGTKIYDGTGDVLGLAQSLVGVRIGKSLCTTSQGHQAVGHLCREEAGRNRIAKDSLRCELDGQVARDVQRCGLRSAVGECGILAQRPDTDSCY